MPGQPKSYQIKVQGQLDESWSDWFDQMTVLVECDAAGLSITTLTGRVIDQAALHGILRRINDLNLPLLSVEQINVSEEENHEDTQQSTKNVVVISKKNAEESEEEEEEAKKIMDEALKDE